VVLGNVEPSPQLLPISDSRASISSLAQSRWLVTAGYLLLEKSLS